MVKDPHVQSAVWGNVQDPEEDSLVESPDACRGHYGPHSGCDGYMLRRSRYHSRLHNVERIRGYSSGEASDRPGGR